MARYILKIGREFFGKNQFTTKKMETTKKCKDCWHFNLGMSSDGTFYTPMATCHCDKLKVTLNYSTFARECFEPKPSATPTPNTH